MAVAELRETTRPWERGVTGGLETNGAGFLAWEILEATLKTIAWMQKGCSLRRGGEGVEGAQKFLYCMVLQE